MKNPWEEIELSDYENHMKLSSVMQLQALNEIMKKQLDTYPIKSVMILGIAGGNGLEHIDTEKVQKVYGVDINRKYLKECTVRYKNLSGIFEAVCADLNDENAVLPNADMIIADLLIEYIGYECFKNTVIRVNPTYVSCVIQINADESFVSDSPYLHVFDNLDKVHHRVDTKGLTEIMNGIGYVSVNKESKKLPNGKNFVRFDFRL